MKPSTRFVKLSDMITEISKQTFFTASRLNKMYDECLEKYRQTNLIRIDRVLGEVDGKGLKELQTHTKSLVDIVEKKIIIKEEIAKMIEDYFYNKYMSDVKNLVDDEFDENVERRGLLNLLEWKKIFNEEIESNENPATTFIPQVHIEELDLYIALKESGGKIKILQTPLIKNYDDDVDKNYNPTIALQRLKIKVVRKIKSASKLDNFNLTYQKGFKCSSCGKTHFLYPHQSNQALKCYCIVKIDKNGNEIRTAHTTTKDGLFDLQYPIYLYEVGIGWRSKQITSYMYSIEKMEKGKYYSDVVNLNVEIEGKKGNVPIIMGSVKKHKIELKTEIFDEMEEKVDTEIKLLNVPKIKLLNVLYASREIIKKYGYTKINNKGFLLQLFIITSAICKHRYGFNKLAISVIGNSGLSKTYSGELLVKLLDNDGIIVGNGKNLTYSGIIGGVNTGGINIGGNRMTIFEEGIATAGGLVLLDEANVYYSDPEINTSLKNLLDGSIRIAKTGAPKEEIPNNYTPIILCNFPVEHKKKYMEKIKENYKKLLRKYPNELHEVDEKSVEKYLSERDFYLPLQHYIDELKNSTLARTISYVRKVYYTNPQMEIDWRTGGSVPSANRILFDVVCNNRNDDRLTEREIPQSPVVPDKDDLPCEEFVEVLKNWNKKKNFNLLDKSKNTKEVNEQIKQLEESIYEFLNKDKKGDRIYTALAWGEKGKHIDSRLEGEVYIFAMTLQLLENENSTKLSKNVKEWLYIMLTKCKRGISEEEYNFINHYYDIENIEYDMGELEMVVKEAEELEEIEKGVKIEQYKELKEKQNNLAKLDEFDLEGDKIE
jgi:hypothetical protein